MRSIKKSKIVHSMFAVSMGLAMSACTAEYALRLTSSPSPNEQPSGGSGSNNEPDPNSNASQDPNNPTGGSSNQPPLICDPFSPGNVISPEFGLRGKIFAESDAAIGPTLTSSFQYFTPARQQNADLFMQAINVPGRRWSSGFATPGGEVLKITVNGQETNLVEWFAIQAESFVVLSETDSLGKKQLAIISDDGSTLELKNESLAYEPFISNEGVHAQKLKVSQGVFNFSARDQKFPIRINYFQGPRHHIALQLLWRDVPNTSSQSLAEPLNGQTGSEHFWDTRVDPPVETSAYTELLSRGWRPLKRENFMLQSGSNRCFTEM